MTILLFPYLDQWMTCQLETRAFLESNAEQLKQNHIELRKIKCEWDNFVTYKKVVDAVWGLDDLIVLEMDVVPTLEMIIKLAKCPEPICAQDYKLNYAIFENGRLSTPMRYEQRSSEGVLLDNDNDGRVGYWYKYKVVHDAVKFLPIDYDGQIRDRAQSIGFGLTKFSKQAQQMISGQNPNFFSSSNFGLDVTVNRWYNSNRSALPNGFHVHYPTAKHNHDVNESRMR